MSNKEFSPIKLQLEEAIWLDHRAQNAEIISLELIPDVDIVEDDYFVNIRGHLVLTGKYETEDEEESLDLESSSLAQQLQFDPLYVEPKEIYEQEYRGKIEHRFPFDVTVPANKVSNLDEVYVQVEQFDYTISDGHRLQIKTEISITGIENESTQTEDKEEQKLEQKQEEKQEKKLELKQDLKEETELKNENKAVDKPETKVWSDFLPVRSKDVQEAGDDVRDEQQEVRKEFAEATQNESKAESAVSKEDKEESRQQELLQEQVAESSQQEQDKERIKSEKEANAGQESSEISTEQADTEIGREERPVEKEVLAEGLGDKVDEIVVPLVPQEIKTTFSSRPEVDDAETEEILATNKDQANGQEEEAKAEQRNNTVSFLTKLMEFGEDGEEETQKSKLRMCIIQQNESLEDISERYDISVYELMKANNLESDQINKGQILYIPKT